ncbi:MAG: glycosyltransferase [Hyphomicrobiaceae bacterium]|nr:glycosyltransferase [Hyphomicrobiaceae bacterium]
MVAREVIAAASALPAGERVALADRLMSDPGCKPRIAVLIDAREWAYDNIFQNVRAALDDDYDLDPVYVRDYPDMADLLVRLLYAAVPDVWFIFWRPAFFELCDRNVIRRCAKKIGKAPHEVMDDLARVIVTTGVYDHNFLDGEGIAQQRAAFNVFDGYATSSQTLFDIYCGLDGYPTPSAILADAVDRSRYVSGNLARLEDTGRPFVIGWVGNSQWGVLEGLIDAKGLKTVIEPAVAVLSERGLDVKLDVVDRAVKLRPRDEVARYYNTLDVLVCASIHEGTPNPALEAMSCGVPLVSTDVGIVREISGALQSSLIVERSAEAMADALQRLLTTPGLRAAVSREQLQQAEMQTWECRYPLWREFFATAIARGIVRPVPAKVALLEQHLTTQRNFKQKVRSFLRQNPQLYALTASAFHYYLKALSSVRHMLWRSGRGVRGRQPPG